MSMFQSHIRHYRTLATLVVIAFATTACSAVVDEGAANSTDEAWSLPDKLVVATGDYKEPTYFLNDQGDLVGLNPDLANALGEHLGIEIEFATVAVDSVLAGIQAGRYDTAIYNMSDKPERRKAVDFVDYAVSGTVIVTRAGERSGITTDPMSL